MQRQRLLQPAPTMLTTEPFRPLPESVEIDGVLCPVNPDFRVFVSMEIQVFSGVEPDVLGLLRAFYMDNVPSNVEAAVERMIEFFRIETEAGGAEPSKNVNRVYDFNMDADALLASFLSAYHIDLSTEKLHWFTFRRLMFNLPPDSPFMERVKYRTADIKRMPKDMQKHYRKMQKRYAIAKTGAEHYNSVEERDEALREKIRRARERAENFAKQN